MSSEADVLDEVPPELVRRVEAALAEDRAEDENEHGLKQGSGLFQSSFEIFFREIR